MPLYDFVCTACETYLSDVALTIAERDAPTTQPCPICHESSTIERCAAAPAIGDGYRMGRRHLPSTWTDTLHRIKDKHRGSSINTYGSKKEL